jgi:hypothetical protein
VRDWLDLLATGDRDRITAAVREQLAGWADDPK